MDLVTRIDEIVRERSLLTHPFYQAWSEGTLPRESLNEYAAQYFHFEAAYPTFLSAIHHRTADPSVRQHLLDNLWDEEHGEENHVELWLRFCDGLGLDRGNVLGGKPVAATADLVSTYRELTSDAPPSAGAAALYAYESQVPAVASAKLEGLSRFYGMDDPRTVAFFEVHRTLDIEHSDAEREMVASLAGGGSEDEAVLDSVETATKALWSFLDGIY